MNTPHISYGYAGASCYKHFATPGLGNDHNHKIRYRQEISLDLVHGLRIQRAGRRRAALGVNLLNQFSHQSRPSGLMAGA
jgi:hypothetical protein